MRTISVCVRGVRSQTQRIELTHARLVPHTCRILASRNATSAKFQRLAAVTTPHHAIRASGKDTKRPLLQAALDYVREGDVLVVHSMDRLARNLDDLRRMVLDLTGKGVHARFVKENLTFTGEDSPMSHLLPTGSGG